MKSMNSMCFMRLICRVVLCRPSKSNRQLRSRTDAQRRRGRSGGHWSEPFRSRTTFRKSESFFSEKKNGSFLPHLVMPSAAKSEWTEENLPLRLLYSMMSLMAALTSSMLSTPLVLFFQKQTCRRYQSSSSRSSAAKNSTLRPQELLSSSFCRRESADR